MIQNYEMLEATRAQHKFRSIWSLDGTPDFQASHCWPDAKVVKYDGHWGSVGLVTAPIKGPTWLDVWEAADQCIRISGDDHHVYIEQFILQGEALDLQTGS